MPTKVHLVKAMVFPIVMYGCESCTIKAEHQIIDVLELWCWRRLLRVLWTSRRSNQSVLKEINPEYSLKGLTLKLQYFGPPDAKSWPIGKGVMLKDRVKVEKGPTEDKMFRWHHRLSGPEFVQTLGHGEGQGSLVCCSPWGYQESDVTKWLNNNWTLQPTTSFVSFYQQFSYLPTLPNFWQTPFNYLVLRTWVF